MSFDDNVVVEAQHLTKCYEVYASPRDRLKQFVLPRLHHLGSALRLCRGEPPRYYQNFCALNDVSFQIRRGETIGIIGRNGSGKSTLLQIIAGTLAPTSGHVTVNGRIAALLELGSGFDPEFTGRENVFLNGQILGLTSQEIALRYDAIVEFADIGDFINRPVKTYSSGMFVRLAFAVQAHIDASIIIIDEALAVGDVFFRQKCYARLEDLRSSGAAIVLVSHSMGDIEQHCDQSILLSDGNQLFQGSSAEAIKRYYLIEQNNLYRKVETSEPTEHERNTGTAPTPDFPEHASISLENARQINTLGSRCLRIAITDTEGNHQQNFRIGETIVIYHEYSFGHQAGFPIGGIIIHTEKGVILHGKNSLQASTFTEHPAKPGSIVRFEHRIVLSIAAGEYTFEVGMASLDTDSTPEHLTNDELESLKIRLVQIPLAGSFTVISPSSSISQAASFHGLTDLQTAVRISIFGNQS